MALLSARDRRLLWVAIGLQGVASILDLIGVVLLGLVGALAVTTVQSQPPPAYVTDIADRLGLQDVSDQALVGILAAVAAAALLSKSIISSVLTRRSFVFLANRQALVAARLTQSLLSQPLAFVQRRSSQETSFVLVQGVGAATVGVLGQYVILYTESALLVLLASVLLLISPWVTLASIAFFGVLAFALQRAMGTWASKIGRVTASADTASLNAIQEAVAAYREVVVADRRAMYADRIQDLRWQAARVSADLQFIGMIPKYIFEAALVVGGFALAAVLFATQQSSAAIGTLILFLAAGTRVMPSILRLQGATLGMRSAAGLAEGTYRLAEDLRSTPAADQSRSSLDALRLRLHEGYPEFQPLVEVDAVSVQYPIASSPALFDVSLTVLPGQSAAFVGRSGAGKSTLADVILGVTEATTGTVRIGGLPPSQATVAWPGGIAYVPQHVAIADTTIRSNVALGFPDEAIDDDLVAEALERSHLLDFLKSQPGGLFADVGEGGSRLSGGQRQRLGIARALYTRPKLLVLDEATSALDAETEVAISETLRELSGQVTTLVIAHRLATIRWVNQVIYLEEGFVMARGSFDEVRSKVPNFERQAQLLGIESSPGV